MSSRLSTGFGAPMAPSGGFMIVVMQSVMLPGASHELLVWRLILLIKRISKPSYGRLTWGITGPFNSTPGPLRPTTEAAMTLGDRLKSLRNERGIAQGEMERFQEITKSHSSLCRRA